MRWKGVFLPVKDLALKDCAEAPGSGLAPEVVCASLARSACSFCSRGLRPVVRRTGLDTAGSGAGAGFAAGAGGADFATAAGLAAGSGLEMAFAAGFADLAAGLGADLAIGDFLT